MEDLKNANFVADFEENDPENSACYALQSDEEIVETQPVKNSFTWWVGMIAIAAYNFLLGAAVNEVLDPAWCTVIAGALSAIMTYCNINNPGIKGRLTP